jgi:SAM-dependent methyltransferase
MKRALRMAAKRILRTLGGRVCLRGFRAEMQILSLPDNLLVGQEVTGRVRLTNRGSRTWRPRGLFPVRLGTHVRAAGAKAYWIFDNGFRMALPRPVSPGEQLEVDCTLQMPNTPWKYELEIDLVRDPFGWFRDAGHAPARVVRRVEGRGAGEADPSFDYSPLYAQLNLDYDYWTVVGPGSRAEFEELGRGKLQFLIDQGLTPDSRILDVGCGTGQLVQPLEQFLSPRGLYYGTDIAPEPIAFCRRRYTRPNFHFLVNGMTSVPITGVAFDVIFLSSVFTHMYPEEIRELLRDLRRLLAPGGAILADAFVSGQVQGHAGSRGLVEINEAYLQEIFASVGLDAAPVATWTWSSTAVRHIYRLTVAAASRQAA